MCRVAAKLAAEADERPDRPISSGLVTRGPLDLIRRGVCG